MRVVRVGVGALPAWAHAAMTFAACASIAWSVAVAALAVAHTGAAATTAGAATGALLVGAAAVWRLRWRSARASLPWVALVFGASVVTGAVAGLVDGGARAAAAAAVWGFASMAPSFVVAGLGALVARSARAARSLDTVDAGERLAVSAGATAAGVSILGALFAGAAAVPALAVALALLGVAAVREVRRARWLARVHDGAELGWAITSEAELETREVVPSVTHGLHDAVLTWVGPSPDPYRAGRPQVIARVPSRRDALVRVPAGRARRAVAIGVACAAVAALPVARSITRPARAAGPDTKVALVAPACGEARAYFAERAREERGVEWASLVTHAEDATIPEGSAVLVVVRRAPAASDEDLARVARSIPCTGKLSISVEEARARAFDVDATLDLDPSARPEVVREDAERAVGELFEVGSSTSLAPHVGLGVEEGAFGWRVRWTLRHVPGVTKARVKVDGREGDVPFGPRELPALGKLTLRDAKGAPLP